MGSFRNETPFWGSLEMVSVGFLQELLHEQFSKRGSLVGSFCKGAVVVFEDLEWDPNLENYPHVTCACQCVRKKFLVGAGGW